MAQHHSSWISALSFVSVALATLVVAPIVRAQNVCPSGVVGTPDEVCVFICVVADASITIMPSRDGDYW